MFALFKEGVFVDFWLNSRDDKDWIERTIKSKGWSPADIEVLEYEDVPRDAKTIIDFDADKNLRIHKIEDVANLDDKGDPVLDENGDPTTLRALTIQSEHVKADYYSNGDYLKGQK